MLTRHDVSFLISVHVVDLTTKSRFHINPCRKWPTGSDHDPPELSNANERKYITK